jgi:hypothetical protein
MSGDVRYGPTVSTRAPIAGTRLLRGAELALIQARRLGRVEVTLGVVFLLSAVFYVWTAGTSVPLSLHDGSQDRYNLLASALLHFHLSVGRAPAALLRLSDPYNPLLNRQFLAGPEESNIYDDVLYHGQLYFVWGAAPALVLLVPLHLLGFEPSASVTVAVYSIAGLGFALATLRVLIRQVGDVPTWTCALAGLALSLCSVIPFLLRTPGVTEDALAGGYCFAMAGVWLAAAALASRRASVPRLALMSLCFGLAAGSRPTLGLCALVLIPVYLRLRGGRPRRSLRIALGLPIAVCVVLLLAYNQARFHQPLEIGSRYQLTGYDSQDAPLGRTSYALPGTWRYATSLPQPMIVFPFVALTPPSAVPPLGLPGPEITGGLLPMTPIISLVVALPWLWRRRPGLLGALAAPLMLLVGAGVAMMLLASYEFSATTERYEVDFATLFALAGLAAWLSLSKGPPGPRRLLARVGGGLLVTWGCVAGLAVSFFGYGNYLQVNHPHTWEALEDAGAPLSLAIDTIIGRPVLAATFTSVSGGTRSYLLGPHGEGAYAIVSPATRPATLVVAGEVLTGTRYQLGVEVAGSSSSSFPAPKGNRPVELPIRLHRGLNHLKLFPVAMSASELRVTRPVMNVNVLSVADRP